MFKKSLTLGVVAGLLAGIVSLLYAMLYHKTLGADFSRVASPVRILASSLFGTVLASIGFSVLVTKMKWKGEIVFNFLFVILSFATLLGPIGFKLPLDLDGPELFLGLAVPMHLFPALAWFTLKPLFFRFAAEV